MRAEIASQGGTHLRSLVLFALVSIGLFACVNGGIEPAMGDVHVGETVDGDGGVELASTGQALTAPDFCWKGSYGRGVGSVPDSCPGKQQDAGLCYPWCASGYFGVGPVCWQQCPAGYTDDGAFCRRDAHIFGANNSQCPWYDTCGVTFARGCSKCPAGYITDGCTCRRDAHIFAKSSYGRGAGAPMQCNGALEYDAGLCYNHCQAEYDGVGPVCWGQCPSEVPVACGAGCASSEAECKSQVISQVTSSLELAVNIASAVTGAPAIKAAGKQVLSAAGRAQLKADLKEELAKAAAQAMTFEQLETTAEAMTQAAEIGSLSWADLDPTGIAAVVEAFNAPVCDNLYVNRAKGRPALQSSTPYGSSGTAARAVDGNTNGAWGHGSVTHTNSEAGAWWRVDLGNVAPVERVVLFNRTDCCSDRLANFHVDVLDVAGKLVARRDFTGVAGARVSMDFTGVSGRFVRVQLKGTNPLSLAEVEVF